MILHFYCERNKLFFKLKLNTLPVLYLSFTVKKVQILKTIMLPSLICNFGCVWGISTLILVFTQIPTLIERTLYIFGWFQICVQRYGSCYKKHFSVFKYKTSAYFFSFKTIILPYKRTHRSSITLILAKKLIYLCYSSIRTVSGIFSYCGL